MRMTVSKTSVRAPDNTPARWLSIIGIGEDGVQGLSPVARRLIEGAELVVGGARHLELAGSLVQGERLTWPTPIDSAYPQILKRRGRQVAVLATGDPFHFGIGKQLAEIVPTDEFVCIPHVSAFALAAARMGWALQDVATITLHGRAIESVVRHLQPGARILALSWDGSTPQKLANLLATHGLGASQITVLEHMGGPHERIRCMQANSGVGEEVEALNTVALEIIAGPEGRTIALAPGLDDSFYQHDGQLTKREMRSIVLSSLAPRRGELLWDIGLGAGSIAIEWLLRDATMRAIGIEEREGRASNAARNAGALGTPDLQIVRGRAPDALNGLPEPDAIFIGGGLTDGVLDAAWSALKPGGRIVANAVTIESEQILLAAFQRLGGELLRIDIARAEPVGSLHGWRAAMPVVHWRIVKS
jgi:precorrin-6Y C5,15-methyltransferase (decarboxylating)